VPNGRLFCLLDCYWSHLIPSSVIHRLILKGIFIRLDTQLAKNINELRLAPVPAKVADQSLLLKHLQPVAPHLRASDLVEKLGQYVLSCYRLIDCSLD